MLTGWSAILPARRYGGATSRGRESQTSESLTGEAVGINYKVHEQGSLYHHGDSGSSLPNGGLP